MLIERVMNELIIKNPELTIDGGIGYCGYGSYLLQQELKKSGIDSTALHGVDLTKNELGRKAYEGQKLIILALDASSSKFNTNFKERYVANGCKLPKGCGHVVLLIENKIYDITSKQFKLPHVYPLANFLDTWLKVYTCDLKVDMSLSDDFYMKKVKHVDKLKITNESMLDSIKRYIPAYAIW